MQLIWSLDFLNCAPFKLRSKVQIDKRITATLDHPKITSRHHNIDIMMAQQILTSVFYIFTGFLQKPESVRIQNSSLNVIFSNLLFLFSNWEQNSKNISFEFANNDFENPEWYDFISRFSEWYVKNLIIVLEKLQRSVNF